MLLQLLASASHSLVERELGQVNRILGSGDQVNKLAHLGLEGSLWVVE